MGVSAAPRVTVLIPTYHRPAQLARCLAAVAQQTWQDWECVVVNDGGPPVDSALAPLAGLPVRLVELPVNAGHAAARNAGLRHARGQLVALCDDDDLWLPDHLASLVAEVENTGADLVYSDAELVRLRAGPEGPVPLQRELFAFDFDPERLRRWNTVIPSTVLYRRALHDRLGGFDEALRDYWDWDWWLRVAPGNTVRRVPAATVLVGIDAGGDNASARPERMAPYLRRLARKHGLGSLPASNFWLMLSEPELQAARRPSRRLWDGRSLPGEARMRSWRSGTCPL